MSQGPDQPNAIGTTTPPMGTGAPPPAPVQSVFGRVGNVLAQLGDYDASQIDNDSSVVGATVADALDALDGQAATRDILFPSDYLANEGNYRVRQVSGTGTFRHNFFVPHDFNSVVSLVAIVAPVANIVAGDIDLFSDYGEQGQSLTQFQETDVGSTYNLTGMVWNALDLTSVFSSLTASMYCGVQIDGNGLGTSLDYFGIRLRYN
jgi:hypothetical protein